MAEDPKLVLKFPTGDLARLQVISEEPDVEVDVKVEQKPGGGEQLIVESILIGGAVLALAKLIYRWWSNAQPGVVIDQRPGANPSVYETKALPGNYVVIFGPDGAAATVDIKNEPEDSIERIIAKILDVFASPIEEIGKSLADKIRGNLEGEDAEVTEGETAKVE